MRLSPIQTVFYGDQTRWFVGVVVNAIPPAGFEGRVKVRIHGIHSPETTNIPERDLPWAQVMVSATEGGGSGIGKSPQLIAGTQVFGVFLDGRSSQVPLVLGAVHKDEYPTDTQKGNVYTSETSLNKSQERKQNTIIEPLKDDDLNETSIDLRRLQAMKFFIDNGYSITHSSAIVANLQNVSDFKLLSPNEGRVGIAGWKSNGSRYKRLIDFAVSFEPKLSTFSYSFQLQFVLNELRNDFLLANKLLLQSTDIETATTVVSKYYIKNANNERKTITAIAERAYDEVYQ